MSHLLMRYGIQIQRHVESEYYIALAGDIWLGGQFCSCMFSYCAAESPSWRQWRECRAWWLPWRDISCPWGECDETTAGSTHC